MNSSGGSPRLRQSEERFRVLFEDAPVAYHEIDKEGRITRVNWAECSMLGYEPSELVGRRLWEIAPAADQLQVRQAVERKLSGAAKLSPFRGRFLHKDGSPLT